MSIAVCPYRPELYDAVFAFYARCFPRRDLNLYRRVWRWQYFENPQEPPDADRIWVVTRGNEVIAHLGTMAARVRLDGEEARGRWSSDLMVDQRYRDGGLGIWLIREWAGSCEVTLAKGLSGEVQRVYEQLGWHRVPLRKVAQLPLNLRALTGRFVENRLVNIAAGGMTGWIGRLWAVLCGGRAGELNYKTVDTFPPQTDEVMQRVAERSGLVIFRDRRYLQWRYVDCPVHRHTIETAWRDGRLKGFAAFSIRPERGFRRGIIHDLELAGEHEGELRGFLAHCLRRMHDCGADEVCFLPRTPLEQRVVASLGFVGRRCPDMMMQDVRRPRRNLADLTRDCNVQLGDGDEW